ncbi:hypothetical protein [Gilvimarinus algae]|uniref:Lipoprotein n=1 Tax=Gilvimarinus algae TaxID=3058037 RepID=A0ABT8TJ03_9GAMM|nr:hypothetical protein [Gilvimarinus sp. SDUM040014]MDO3383469.1 hypothetical protein [Gilvimarinus sp. SDUM040014]
MRGALVLLACVLLAGCARQPLLPDAAHCVAPEPATLLVRSGDTRLVVRSERQGDEPVFVALDMLGSPLFSARQEGAALKVQSSGLYRGPDAVSLLQGLSWWQIRERITAQCAGASGLELITEERGLTLNRGPVVVWQWRADQPQRFDLPEAGISVKVDEASS